MWLHPKLEVVLALIRAKRATSSIRVPSEISMRGTISAALHFAFAPSLPGFLQQWQWNCAVV